MTGTNRDTNGIGEKTPKNIAKTGEAAGYIEGALKAGLSGKAATVYVALLEAGLPLVPKAIISRSRLHRQYVYDALRELTKRGLCVAVGGGRGVKYQAASPDRLLQDAEKQRLDALDAVSRLMKLYDRSPAGVVEVIRGSQAMIESELEQMREAKDGDFLDIIGGAGMRWVHIFGEHIPKWEALRREKNIKLRYIGVGEDVEHNRTVSIIENESRVIPGIGDVISTSIRPGSITFIIYVPEVMVVRVRNEATVASQRALFEILWNVAK